MRAATLLQLGGFAAPQAPRRSLTEQVYLGIFSMRAVHRQREGGLYPRPFPKAPSRSPLLLRPIPPSPLSAGAIPADLGARGLDARVRPVYRDKKSRWREMYKLKQRCRQALEGGHRERHASVMEQKNTAARRSTRGAARQPEQLRARHARGLTERLQTWVHVCRQARGDGTPANAWEETDVAKQRNAGLVERDKDGKSRSGTWGGEAAGAAAQACATAPFPKGRGERLDESSLFPNRWPDPDRRQQLLSAPGPTRSSRARLQTVSCPWLPYKTLQRKLR